MKLQELKRIAAIYKKRDEFKNFDCLAYMKAKHIGVLDDICNHMSDNYSIFGSLENSQRDYYEKVVSDLFKRCSDRS